MKCQKKNDIRSRVRLIYGLVHILKDDVDNLRIDVSDFDLDRLDISIANTNETLEKLIDAIAEVEYAVYQIKFREKNT